MVRSRQPSVLVPLLIAIMVLALGGFAAYRFSAGQTDSQFRRLSQQVMKADIKGGLRGSDVAMRRKFLDLAHANPGSRAEVMSCVFVADRWPETPEAAVAYKDLLRAVSIMSIDDLAQCFDTENPGQGKQWHGLAVLLMRRVQQEPDHPKAASLLSDAAIIFDPDMHDGNVPDELLQIAELIQEQYADSPDLANFCEIVSDLGDPAPWMQSFEPHVREILRVNQDRFVRCSAHFALATIVRSAGIERQEEARQIFKEFLARFDGATPYRAQSVEQRYRQQSETFLKELESRGTGIAEAETPGLELDGNSMEE